MKIALLGIGLMGDPMARRLCQAGHEVHVWNRTAAKAQALADCGALPHTLATQAVSFLPDGTWRNSFGPCAFELGPRRPVIRNCASGNFAPSMPMNGIVPPSPMAIIGLIQKNKHIKLAGNDKLRIERALPEVKDRVQMVRDVLRSLGTPQTVATA